MRDVLVIFAKLVINEADRDWIERIRRVHDPQHALVEPHFTLMFPFAGIPIERVIPHVESVVGGTPAIGFALRRASAVRDPLSSRTHLFLLPEEGNDALHRVHDNLYSGVLATKSDADIPFVPHVTVGAFESYDEAKRVARSLKPISIIGKLDREELAEF
jgi:2'-5' RNA ligase